MGHKLGIVVVWKIPLGNFLVAEELLQTNYWKHVTTENLLL